MTQPGLYFHVPFCQKKCAYCNFYSVTSLSDIPKYTKAILDEISLYANEYKCFDTIYIGGGTPSLLTAADLSEILLHVRKTFTIDPDTEITVEANPADAHPDWLTSLRHAGLDRINLGVQSFDDSILRFLGRRHTGRKAVGSIEQARAAGFENIGLDLIYGIPDQSLSSWEDTLVQALAFEPEHLSCYQLSLEGDTPLQRGHEQGHFALPDEDAQVDFFMTTADILESAGYHHYEVSSFARAQRFKSRHNRKYWRHVPYLGLGPAAHSFSGQRRWWNHRSLKQYLSDVGQSRRPVAGSEQLTPSRKRLETWFLGMRTGEGVSIRFLSEQGVEPFRGKRGETLDNLALQGLIVIQDGFIRPTRKGMAVADRLALMF